MALLATKLLLAPLCVVGVSLAARRWGVAIAGVLGGLPVVAGPILLILTLLHGRSFGASAAAATLLGLGALTLFVVVYGLVAPKAGVALSVLSGWTAFLIGVALLTLVHPSALASLAFVCTGFALGLALLGAPRSPPAPLPGLSWWDLPARALAALSLVLVLTAASGALGPELSGLLAPFPIVTSVLVVFTHAHDGVEQARVLLRNFSLGFYGFAAFCFVLAISLPDLEVLAAFIAALLTALVVQAVTFVLRARLEPADQRD